MPAGQQAYLRRLRCADGEAPKFERVGSVGPRNEPPEGQDVPFGDLSPGPLKPGEIDYHIVDRYEVRCPEGMRAVFMDLYHCGVPAPATPVAGFSIE